MLPKYLTVATMAAVLSAGAAQAQSLGRLGGPANLPPAGFDGQQFVDARGCLFMRAGYGANVTWIPRVDRNRNPICGFPPSFGPAVIAAVQADMAPEPPATAPAPQQPAAAAARAPQVAAPSPSAVAPPRQGGFWAALFGAPQARPVAQAPAQPASVAAPVATAPARLATIPKPPKGYRLAWTDDRLNPLRGIGTPQGQAQQDLVWTRDIPAKLVEGNTPAMPARQSGQVTVSTMSAPQADASDAGTGQAYVQVGSFAEPGNAQAAKDRLRALGLPVATSQITRKGKLMTIVFAGPFAGADAARAGLASARSAGFDDAVLRMN